MILTTHTLLTHTLGLLKTIDEIMENIMYDKEIDFKIMSSIENQR